jgi:hypothetical protein
MHRAWAGAILAGAVAMAIGGCSASVSIGGKKIDAGKLERSISETVSGSVGVVPERVDCPDDVALKKGHTFQCTARVNGQDAAVRVTQSDDDGNVRFENVDALLSTQKLVDAIANGVNQQTGRRVTVNCGSRQVLVEPVGARLSCQAVTASGESETITVNVLDRQGNVNWRLDGSASPTPAT